MKEVDTDLVPQIIAPPPIVVSTHEDDWDARIHQGGQSAKHPGVATRDYTPVLKPEIEQVAIDDDFGGHTAAVVEPREESLLDLRGCRTQVNVTGQVDRWTLHGGRR